MVSEVTGGGDAEDGREDVVSEIGNEEVPEGPGEEVEGGVAVDGSAEVRDSEVEGGGELVETADEVVSAGTGALDAWLVVDVDMGLDAEGEEAGLEWKERQTQRGGLPLRADGKTDDRKLLRVG